MAAHWITWRALKTLGVPEPLLQQFSFNGLEKDPRDSNAQPGLRTLGVWQMDVHSISHTWAHILPFAGSSIQSVCPCHLYVAKSILSRNRRSPNTASLPTGLWSFSSLNFPKPHGWLLWHPEPSKTPYIVLLKWGLIQWKSVSQTVCYGVLLTFCHVLMPM